MKTLLRIDSSPRFEGSHTRKLADYFQSKWLDANHGGRVISRDLTKTPVPHVQNETIAGFHTPADQINSETIKATAISDELITEIKSADEVLLSTPLYNFNVPSSLKAYIDHICRAGQTFNYSNEGYSGLLGGRRAYIITAKGGSYKGTIYETLDYQEPYLKTVFDVLGFDSTEIISLEGTAQSFDVLEKNIKVVNTQIDQLIF